jgi:linoleoyl-CoA desaturase
VEEASHPIQNDKSEIENDWAIHQMNTTVNFARHNKFITWYVGGLNYQVEHHLFPSICHIHYPKIAEIVKRTAEEFQVPYLESPTFWMAFRSHINALKELGSKKDVKFALHFDN